MGRRSTAHEPTAELRKLAEAAAAFGIPHDDIAAVIGVDPKTLRKHYKAELKRGSTRAIIAVANNLYTVATSTTRNAQMVTAAIFFLKTRGGWRETQRIENTGADGKPIEHNHAVVKAESVEEARRLLEQFRAGKAGGFQRPAPVVGDGAPEPDQPAG